MANASDADGDTFSITDAVATSAAGTTEMLLDSNILYTPAAGFSGIGVFLVFIQDARGAVTMGMVVVTVGPGPNAGGVGVNPPVLTILPDGKLGIAFHGIPGRSYVIQRSVNGLDNWATLATVTADASGKAAFTDESPPSGSAFYRLGLQ